MKLAKLCAAFILLITLVFAYSNHFNNPFHFDDFHTIVHNTYIQDLSNIGIFFTDIVAFGTNPGNRTYNPVLVTLNAIDYAIAGGLDPFYFHLSIFISFIALGVLLYFFFRRIFLTCYKENFAEWLSICAVAFYMLHAANPETINYIIMRSDSFSTLMIVASFVLFQNEKLRKYHLHLITLLIGIGTKEITLMFAFILPVYVLLIERRSFGKAILWSILPIFVGVFALVISRKLSLPDNVSVTDASIYANPAWEYMIAQWYVIANYWANFILPLGLSVDHDFVLAESILERKILLSLFLHLFMLGVAIRCAFEKSLRPVSFGLVWFYFALAPTSSFIPFAQIANDHRTFFPYIGLVIAFACLIGNQLQKLPAFGLRPKCIRAATVLIVLTVLVLHAYGTYQRNFVWASTESLWGDAIKKSPNNGRVQMNYGLALMEKGDLQGALPHFEKAIQALPFWAYTHINMGILQNALGNEQLATLYFKNAMKFQPEVPAGYYFYARFLNSKGRLEEALKTIEQGLAVSSNYEKLHILKTSILSRMGPNSSQQLEQEIAKHPTAEGYLDLSLSYYNSGNFPACIAAAEKALKIRPNYTLAYNNICSAHIALKAWPQAIQACKKALEIDPNYDRAKNNLKLAEQQEK